MQESGVAVSRGGIRRIKEKGGERMYLAIDGGGTKTEYLLLDEAFRTAGRYLGGCEP